MNGVLLNEIFQIGAKHALYREDGIWYHHLKKFPGVLFDKNGYLLFQTEEDYKNHPELRHTQDLNVKRGISVLEGYTLFSEVEKKQIILNVTEEVDEESVRILRQVGVIVRNLSLVRKLKKKYKDTCQICGTTLMLRTGVFYSEIHHIKPLGNPHIGPDKIENMICVCPNHHVLLDFHAIELKLDKLQTQRHQISEEYILYHNDLWKSKVK